MSLAYVVLWHKVVDIGLVKEREFVATNKLHITLDGPRVSVDEGVSMDDLRKTFTHVEKAIRLMMSHLSEISGQHAVLRDRRVLRVTGFFPGSFGIESVVSLPSDSQALLMGSAPDAVNRILDWNGERDDGLPLDVADELIKAINGLSPDVDVVRLGDPMSGREVEIRRQPREPRAVENIENALLHGWLKEVNWHNGTAQLHRYRGKYVPLRFANDLSETMRNLATQYVEVRGSGRINEQDRWTSVQVREVNATRSGFEPFDLDAFLNNLDPEKVFDPENVVTVSEPFDVDAFLKEIYDARDVGREELTE